LNPKTNTTGKNAGMGVAMDELQKTSSASPASARDVQVDGGG